MELSPSCLMRKQHDWENRFSPRGKCMDYDFTSVINEAEPFWEISNNINFSPQRIRNKGYSWTESKNLTLRHMFSEPPMHHKFMDSEPPVFDTISEASFDDSDHFDHELSLVQSRSFPHCKYSISWGFGVLGFWGFGVLGFWGFVVLGCARS